MGCSVCTAGGAAGPSTHQPATPFAQWKTCSSSGLNKKTTLASAGERVSAAESPADASSPVRRSPEGVGVSSGNDLKENDGSSGGARRLAVPEEGRAATVGSAGPLGGLPRESTFSLGGTNFAASDDCQGCRVATGRGGCARLLFSRRFPSAQARWRRLSVRRLESLLRLSEGRPCPLRSGHQAPFHDRPLFSAERIRRPGRLAERSRVFVGFFASSFEGTRRRRHSPGRGWSGLFRRAL